MNTDNANGKEKKEDAQMIPHEGADFPITQPIGTTESATALVEATRAQTEVQTAMIVAKRFPRDETKSYNNIMKACKRKSLANQACYSYPRGGQTVTGPSIRLAEVMARHWGNLKFGIRELDQRKGESEVQSYCWDLETNVLSEKLFTVKHERHTRTAIKALTDTRDIYEVTANQGARRVRACILAIIPGDVVDAAVAACRATMAGSGEGPLEDRIRKMVGKFWDDHRVPQDSLEKRLKHKIDLTTEEELIDLIQIYNSLRDNISTRESFFKLEDQTQTGDAADLNDKFAGKDSGKE